MDAKRLYIEARRGRARGGFLGRGCEGEASSAGNLASATPWPGWEWGDVRTLLDGDGRFDGVVDGVEGDHDREDVHAVSTHPLRGAAHASEARGDSEGSGPWRASMNAVIIKFFPGENESSLAFLSLSSVWSTFFLATLSSCEARS